MNNPTVFGDGVANILTDSDTRILHRVLGALKNLGGQSQSVASGSGRKENVTSIGSNGERKSITIQNLSGSALYVKFGSGASSTDFHAALAAESGSGTGGNISLPGYTGVISLSPSTNEFTVLELN